jgi:hypothetical protein
MIVKITAVYDTETQEFLPASNLADALVFVAQDLNGTTNSIVSAIRTTDRKHFSWLASSDSISELAKATEKYTRE